MGCPFGTNTPRVSFGSLQSFKEWTESSRHCMFPWNIPLRKQSNTISYTDLFLVACITCSLGFSMLQLPTPCLTTVPSEPNLWTSLDLLPSLESPNASCVAHARRLVLRSPHRFSMSAAPRARRAHALVRPAPECGGVAR